MAGDFIERSRHGTVFYFRRRVPRDLRDVGGERHIYVKLRTNERRTALIRARAIAVHTDQAFRDIRSMPKDKAPKYVDTFYGILIDMDDLTGRTKRVTFTDVSFATLMTNGAEDWKEAEGFMAKLVHPYPYASSKAEAWLRAERETRKFLTAGWPDIENVAEALRKKGRLEAGEVVQLAKLAREGGYYPVPQEGGGLRWIRRG
jgi:hypothetical protein